MKRKYVDRSDWMRISKSKSKTLKVDTDDFNGYIYGIFIEEVNKKFEVEIEDEKYMILNDGYTWIQIIPMNEHYTITTIYDENKNIVQWYIDITKMNGVNSEGKPFYDDMYLDIIVTPDEKIFLKDEDELNEALSNNLVTSEEYKAAYKEARDIMDLINKNKINYLEKLSSKAMEKLKL